MTWEEVPVDTAPAAGAVLLSGIPGSGKSTVAAALAARFTASAHIEVDALQELIVTGGRWPVALDGAGRGGGPRRTGPSWTRRCAPNWPTRAAGSTTPS
ncbi:hypothetical protein [Streptomyces sp. NPDC088706]|uniref:hypothetical protein n=1 Tax=Streptomyces sp. NPDC088706 TaxID=3365870 RepID=UPI00382371CF